MFLPIPQRKGRRPSSKQRVPIRIASVGISAKVTFSTNAAAAAVVVRVVGSRSRNILLGGHDYCTVFIPPCNTLGPGNVLNRRSPEAVKLGWCCFPEARRRPFHEIAKERGHLPCLFIPFLSRTEWFVVLLRKEDMHLTFSQEATEVLAGLTPMGVVVSGTMNAGTLIDLSSSSLAPMTGRSAPSRKYSRQCDMTAMKRSGFILINASRFSARALMRSFQCSMSQTLAMPPCLAASMNCP